MAGGEPAGINILPGELGCLTNRTKMSTTTSTGKTRTTPNGMETAELPRRRNGLWKNAKLDANPLFLGRFSSDVGSSDDRAAPVFDRRKISMAISNQPAYTAGIATANQKKTCKPVGQRGFGRGWRRIPVSNVVWRCGSIEARSVKVGTS